jgi:acyl-CoA reductase-like NAD-dependent aldehyde dehydrogenase
MPIADTLLPFDLPMKPIVAGKPCDCFRGGGDSDLLIVRAPVKGHPEVGHCYRLDESKVESVAKAAVVTFERYRKTPLEDRVLILERLAASLEYEAKGLAQLIVAESGKPLKLARIEVARGVALCRAYVDAVSGWEQDRRIDTLPDEKQARLRQVPRGPALGITPFNFPLNLALHKLLPAIGAGCSMVLKPASQTPLTALWLGQLAVESGYTALSVVPCSSNVAMQLAEHDAFAKLSFTGSAMVGWQLHTLAERKSVTLELGGNAACIIDTVAEGELEAVAKRCAEGAFWYAGQICISLQRIYVRRPLYQDFLDALIDATHWLKIGDPIDPMTDVGPMISSNDVTRTHRLVKEAQICGAEAVTGGVPLDDTIYSPTILVRTTPDMTVNREEVFAPLVTITPYDTLDEAFALANDSDYGIQTGLYTTDPEVANRAFDVLEAGGVVINDIPTYRADLLPYGGVKQSGLGREGVLGGLESYCTPKTLLFPADFSL